MHVILERRNHIIIHHTSSEASLRDFSARCIVETDSPISKDGGKTVTIIRAMPIAD
jgi:hypothetical protein